jgi:excisionase family DNA binding protein
MTERYFTRREVAETLRVSVGTIDKLVRRKNIRSIKVEGRRRISEQHLQDYVAALEKDND